MLRMSPAIRLRGFALLSLLAGLLLAPAAPVWACSCASRQGPGLALSQAAAVFTGSVTSVANRSGFDLFGLLRRVFTQTPQGSGGAARMVAFDVTASWKGVTETPVRVGTGSGSADCGFDFNVGGQYLVYVYSDGAHQWRTGTCTRTAELSQAPSDLANLQTQATLPVALGGRPAILWYVAGAGLAGLLILTAGALWVWRRRTASIH